MKPQARLSALLLVLIGVIVAFLLFWDPASDTPDTAPSGGADITPESSPPPLLGSEAAPEPHKKTPPPRTPGEPQPGEVSEGAVLRVTGAGGDLVARAFVRLVRDVEDQPGDGRPNIISEHRATLPLELPRLEETTWIEVMRPRDASDKDLPLASGWGGPFDAGESSLVVVLASRRVVAGRVLDARGRPLENARVEAYFGVYEGLLRKLRGSALSAADGSFRIGRLQKGTCYLEVWPRGANAWPPPFAVEAGSTDLELRTLPGLAARLIVVDGAGAPVPKARLTVSTRVPRGSGSSGSVTLSEGTTNEAGFVVLDGLDLKRTYALRTVPPIHRKDLIEVFERAWKPRHGTYTLRHGVEVSGRVTDGDGKPFPNADLTVRPVGSGVVPMKGTSRKDGTFVVQGVPEGEILIRGFRRDAGSLDWMAASLKAKAPSTDIHIVMKADPVGTFTVRFGSAGGPADRALVRLSEIKDGKTTPGGSTTSVRKGVATLRRVRMKRIYVLYACSRDKGLCALVRDILPEKGAIDVTLVAAHTIRGRVDVPDGATNLTVYARGPGVYTGEKVGAGGDFVLKGLPPGTYEVGARAKAGGRVLHKAVEAKTGDSIDIKLE